MKKSDLVSKYGRGPYRSADRPLHFSGDEEPYEVQGPDSVRLKYVGSLCSHCNNTLSQPYDRAYEAFMAWVFAHEEDVLRHRIVDLREVFGSHSGRQAGSLVRYFCKSLGCRIHDAKRPVPTSLAEAVRGGRLPRAMAVSFSVQEDIADNRDFLGQFIGKADLYGNLEPSKSPFYIWEEKMGWVTSVIRYRQPHEPTNGTLLRESTPVLHLGGHTAFDTDARAALYERMRQIRAEHLDGSLPNSPGTEFSPD